MKKPCRKLLQLISWHHVLLLVVLIVFIGLRFTNIYRRIQFNWDQERDARAAREILDGNFTLIGPRVLGADNFFLGPYFYYLLMPFYWLSGGHPRAMIYFLLVNSLLFFVLAWLFLKEKYSFPVALTFLGLWAVNPALVKADIICWNPVVLPTLIILLWRLLDKIRQDNRRNIFIIGLLLSVGINFHFQFIFLIPFALVVLYKKAIRRRADWLALAVGLAIGFLPLLIFDLRHNFLNSKLLWQFIHQTGQAKDWLAWQPVVQNFFHRFLGFSLPTIISALIFPLLGGLLFLKKSDNNFWLSAGVIFLLILPVFAFYGQRPSEYYLNFTIPFLLLLLARLSAGNKLGLALIIFLIGFWGLKSYRSITPDQFSLYHKEKVVQYIDSEVSQAQAYYNVPMGRDTGYRYLLDYYGTNNPEADSVFEIIIPPNKKPVNFQSGGIGVKRLQ